MHCHGYSAYNYEVSFIAGISECEPGTVAVATSIYNVQLHF